MIVHRDGPTVRVYSRNACDWTVRLASIAAAAEMIKAKSFTIDGEAVVLGRGGVCRPVRRGAVGDGQPAVTQRTRGRPERAFRDERKLQNASEYRTDRRATMQASIWSKSDPKPS
jgi:hypothetical protein